MSTCSMEKMSLVKLQSPTAPSPSQPLPALWQQRRLRPAPSPAWPGERHLPIPDQRLSMLEATHVFTLLSFPENQIHVVSNYSR